VWREGNFARLPASDLEHFGQCDRLRLRRGGAEHQRCLIPLLLDRNVGVAVAVHTSVRAVLANPLTMALWGLIVVASLAIGFLLLVGLALVVPILAPATWHLYRRVVERAPP
jgi:uncharacterized membrane protein